MAKQPSKVLHFDDTTDARQQFEMIADGWSLPQTDPRADRAQIREDARLARALREFGVPHGDETYAGTTKPRLTLPAGGGDLVLEPHQVRRLLDVVPTAPWRGFMREALDDLLTWLENLPDAAAEVKPAEQQSA